jgi:hypothetical protein
MSAPARISSWASTLVASHAWTYHAAPVQQAASRDWSSDAGPAIFLIGSLLIGLAVLYWASGPRYVLVLDIEGGVARVRRGRVKPVLLEEVNEICVRNGLTHGNIWGIQAKKRITLRFSRHFPESCRQQIRNVWALYA